MLKPLIHILLLWLTVSVSLVAQVKKGDINYVPNSIEINDFTTEEIVFSDTLQLIEEVSKSINALHKEGFLLSRVTDITIQNDSLYEINVFLGPQFEWATLSAGNLPQDIQSKAFRQKFYTKTPFRLNQISSLYSSILRYAQSNGYPFASVGLDSISITTQSVKAMIDFEPGPFIAFDSILINSDVNIKKKWLQAYLEINAGNAYDQSKVDNISRRIKKLPFLELTEEPIITFKNEKAEIKLQIKKRRSNRIDGIVGFLPNEKADGSTLITGEFEMDLNNIFGSGKALDVHWQSLKPQSQLLEIGYLHRNLLHSPLNFKSSFYLLKEDSSFINRKGLFSFHYQPSLHDISIFTRLETSRSLSSDQIKQPDIADFNINYYGLRHEFVDVTNTRVPRGVATQLEVAVGGKSLRNNLADTQIGLEQKTTQFNLLGGVEGLFQISKTFGASFNLRGAKIFNKQLFLNDLYRLGGLNSLRGFNENFFFAEEYLSSSIEARLYYEVGSYIFLFYDQAYIYYDLAQTNFKDYPLGIGLGLSLQTSNGMLKLAYALGKSNEQPLSLSLSKFHFGYVANF